MSLILSIAVLAFVAYDFVLLTRMRKAVNAAIEMMPNFKRCCAIDPPRSARSSSI